MSVPLVTIEFLPTRNWPGELLDATAEEAIYAARHVGWEARKHVATQGFNPTITFSVDDKIVRTTTLRDLGR